MTPAEVAAALAAIKGEAGDWEATHGMSDDLWESVLLSIADGTTDDPARIARMAVDGIRELGYTRWYA